MTNHYYSSLTSICIAVSNLNVFYSQTALNTTHIWKQEGGEGAICHFAIFVRQFYSILQSRTSRVNTAELESEQMFLNDVKTSTRFGKNLTRWFGQPDLNFATIDLGQRAVLKVTVIYWIVEYLSVMCVLDDPQSFIYTGRLGADYRVGLKTCRLARPWNRKKSPPDGHLTASGSHKRNICYSSLLSVL